MAKKLIAQLRKKIGRDSVLTGAAAAAPRGLGKAPVAVALPGDVEQLRATLSVAAANGAALWVLPNAAGNGGSVNPSPDRDILLVDLSRMNRIIEVNAKSAYALVEPGVSYAQLNAYLRENDTGLWVDCDRNGLNSVAGSIMAREFGYTAYGDHTMMQCGMEVMLADGGLVRLGMGAMPNSNTWQLAKYAYGPYLDGLFTQSNLGVVTKMGLWLMPAPPAYQPFAATLGGDSDLAQAVEILRAFKVNMIVPNTVVISNPALDASPFRARQDYAAADGKGGLDMARLREDYGLGAWTLYGALYNTPPNVEVLWPMVRGAFAGIDGARVIDLKEPGDNPVLAGREALMRGQPAEDFGKVWNWSGDSFLYVSFVAPLNGRQVMKMNKLAGDTTRDSGFDYLAEYAVGWRFALQRVYLPYGAGQEGRARACLNALIDGMARRGFGVGHISASHLERALASYDNKGMATLRTRIKQALDPDNLFA